MDLDLKLSFTLNEEDDILNATIRDSYTGCVMYTLETPKYAKGILTTTATRTNQIDGSTRTVFKILWKGKKGLEDATVVLGNGASEMPIRDIFRAAPGSDTLYVQLVHPSAGAGQTLDRRFFDSGSIFIEDVEYRWKTKGTGLQAVVS